MDTIMNTEDRVELESLTEFAKKLSAREQEMMNAFFQGVIFSKNLKEKETA